MRGKVRVVFRWRLEAYEPGGIKYREKSDLKYHKNSPESNSDASLLYRKKLPRVLEIWELLSTRK